MSIIIPILYGAVLVGLFAHKITRGTITTVVIWVTCVLLWYYIRH